MTATWASARLPLGAAAPAPEARRRGRPPAARTPLGPPGPGSGAHRACACGSSPGAGPLGLLAQFPAPLRGSVGVWLRRCRRPRGSSAQPAREVGCAAARGLPLAAPDPGTGRLSAGRPVPPTGVRPGARPPTGARLGSRPPTGACLGSRPPTGACLGSRPPTGACLGSRPPTGARPGSRPSTGACLGSRPPTGARPGARPPAGPDPAPDPTTPDGPSPYRPGRAATPGGAPHAS